MVKRSFPHTTVLTAFFTPLLWLLILSCPTVKHSLRYRMTRGTTYRYAVTHDWQSSTVTRGKTMESASSGTAWISLAIDSIRLNGEFVCTGRVDSANISFGPAFGKDTSVVRDFFGKRVRMILSPVGKTLSITPIDSLPTGKRASAYAQFGPQQLLRTIFFVLPEQPFGIGESWDVPLEQSAGIGRWNSSMHGGTTFRLGETERVGSHECIRILIEGTIAGRTGGTTRSGIESGSESRSTTNGVALFDLQQGLAVSEEVTFRTYAASTVKRLPWSSDGTLKRSVRLLE